MPHSLSQDTASAGRAQEKTGNFLKMAEKY